MSEIDRDDDDSLRFVQRVLESNASDEDRRKAREMVVAIRTRVLKEYASRDTLRRPPVVPATPRR